MQSILTIHFFISNDNNKNAKHIHNSLYQIINIIQWQNIKCIRTILMALLALLVLFKNECTYFKLIVYVFDKTMVLK